MTRARFCTWGASVRTLGEGRAASSFAALLLAVGLLITPGCARQTSQSGAGTLPSGGGAPPMDAAAISAHPVKLRPGDVVKVFVWREPELSRDYEVDGAGRVDVPKLGPVTVAGLSPDSLRSLLMTRFARSLRQPTIEVSMRRRISVFGSVRNPGIFQVDPYTTVADALALAGGITPDGRNDYVRVLRGNATLRTKISTRTVIADSPVESGDQLFVPDRGWLTRNLGLISAAMSAAGMVIIALR